MISSAPRRIVERSITFIPDREMRLVDTQRRVVTVDDGREFPYDLFLGVPAIRTPKMLEDCGVTENKYVPVSPKTLESRFPDVYAVGDCARQGTPKAGYLCRGRGTRRRDRADCAPTE
jgi:sulfide:quinone oxidoreductase